MQVNKIISAGCAEPGQDGRPEQRRKKTKFGLIGEKAKTTNGGGGRGRGGGGPERSEDSKSLGFGKQTWRKATLGEEGSAWLMEGALAEPGRPGQRRAVEGDPASQLRAERTAGWGKGEEEREVRT